MTQENLPAECGHNDSSSDRAEEQKPHGDLTNNSGADQPVLAAVAPESDGTCVGSQRCTGAGAIEGPAQAPLTVAERKVKADLERIIADGWLHFFEVGLALAEIRESGLFREDYLDFETYCQERWQIGKSHRCRLMGAAAVMRDLSPIGDQRPLPMNESQCRPLVKVEPEQRLKVWLAALEKAGNKPVTARIVKQAAAAFLPQAKQESKEAGKRKKTSDGPDKSALALVDQVEQAVTTGATKEKVLQLLEELKQMLADPLSPAIA